MTHAQTNQNCSIQIWKNKAQRGAMWLISNGLEHTPKLKKMLHSASDEKWKKWSHMDHIYELLGAYADTHQNGSIKILKKNVQK